MEGQALAEKLWRQKCWIEYEHKVRKRKMKMKEASFVYIFVGKPLCKYWGAAPNGLKYLTMISLDESTMEF